MLKLKIVPPSEPPAREKLRQRIKRMPKPPLVLECRCGSREMSEVRVGAVLKNGRLSGGTVQIVCVACGRKGERVVVA